MNDPGRAEVRWGPHGRIELRIGEAHPVGLDGHGAVRFARLFEWMADESATDPVLVVYNGIELGLVTKHRAREVAAQLRKMAGVLSDMDRPDPAGGFGS